MSSQLSAYLQQRQNFYILRHASREFIFLYVHLLCSIYRFLHQADSLAIKNAVAAVFTGFNDRAITDLSGRIERGADCHYAEKFHNILTTPASLNCFFSKHIDQAAGVNALRGRLAPNKGVLLITAHFGGIEYLPFGLSSLGLPVAIVAEFASADLKRLSEANARIYGLDIIDPAEQENGMTAIFKSLRAGRIVIVVCDEIKEWRPSPNKQLAWLGQRTYLDRRLDVLVKRCRAMRIPILIGACLRLNRHAYRLQVEPADYHFSELIMADWAKIIACYPDNWYQWKNFFSLPR